MVHHFTLALKSFTLYLTTQGSGTVDPSSDKMAGDKDTLIGMGFEPARVECTSPVKSDTISAELTSEP